MHIRLIGAPMDLGADRRGVDMGPSAILYADIADKLQALGYEVEHLDSIKIPFPETRSPGDPRLKYLDQILSCSRELAHAVEHCIREGALPVTLGGDHSIALGSISGAANALGELGVIWFDAHADFNTEETTPSANMMKFQRAYEANAKFFSLVNTTLDTLLSLKT